MAKERIHYPNSLDYHYVVVLEHEGTRITADLCTRWWAKGTTKPTLDTLPAEDSDNDCSCLPLGKPLEMVRQGTGLFYFYTENGLSEEILLDVAKEEKL
jgi:hypothetical protein